MKTRPAFPSNYALMQWTILPAHLRSPRGKKLNPLRIYSLNLDQSQAFLTSPLSPNLSRQPEHFYPHLFLEMHTHSTTSTYFSLQNSSKRLLRIQIDTQVCKECKYGKRERENGQICLWRSYTYLLTRLYIWEYTRSLNLRYIRIQTLIRAFYIRSQPIYHVAALSRLSGTAISRVLRAMKEQGITYLLIRFSNIGLSL
jgi:hypothetical protein